MIILSMSYFIYSEMPRNFIPGLTNPMNKAALRATGHQ
jgi:hypothetical protein